MESRRLQDLLQAFLVAVNAVKPQQLVKTFLQQHKSATTANALNINGQLLELSKKRCHVVGFGKAVLGMSQQLESELRQQIVGGILSIPEGQLSAQPTLKATTTRIEIIEGAANNQPDAKALKAAQRIKHLAQQMRADDVLFVLISGGGSALLPLPRPTLELDDKMQLIRRLSNAGAQIEEMNILRIALSDIKGGRLAAAAQQAHACISLVISDIVGDPLDLIASGPTYATRHEAHATAREVLLKYQMWLDLPRHVRKLLETPVPLETCTPGANNHVFMLGSNKIAIQATAAYCAAHAYNVCVLSSSIVGEVQQVAQQYVQLLHAIDAHKHGVINDAALRAQFQAFDAATFPTFLQTLRAAYTNKRDLLLICAGEPTVKVTGSGRGGRNQELALRMALQLHKCGALFQNIIFLSASTDGADGPTPAAGAFASCALIESYLQQNAAHTLADVETYLHNNDSYNFYQQLQQQRNCYHVICGHTGTNVMDLHFLLIPVS